MGQWFSVKLYMFKAFHVVIRTAISCHYLEMNYCLNVEKKNVRKNCPRNNVMILIIIPTIKISLNRYKVGIIIKFCSIIPTYNMCNYRPHMYDYILWVFNAHKNISLNVQINRLKSKIVFSWTFKYILAYIKYIFFKYIFLWMNTNWCS